MPQINLIESQILAVRKIERQTRISKFTFLGTVGVVGLAYVGLAAQSSAITAEEDQIKEQLKKLKPLVEKIDANKKESGDLTPRLKTLEDAQQLTNRWGRLMAHLTTNTPSTIWLSSLRATVLDPTRPIHVTFSGVGQTQTDVSEMVLRCQNAQDLETVNLVQSSERLLERTSAVEFEIAGDIVGTADKKPKVDTLEEAPK